MTLLHFTLGPMQSFVAQARRTRDLYAGSFLLSHLALRAMDAAGGKVILPDYAGLRDLTAKQHTKHAIAPNRFLAEFTDDDFAAKAGEAASAALQKEWHRITEAVWRPFLEPLAAQGRGTRDIWDRQVANSWEIAWAVGPDSDLLDRRKNWRAPPTTTEGGDHCTLMPQWQELSGFIRSKERKKQDAFWSAVRQRVGNRLDLEEDERFCAIAFVKRFFPRVSEDAIGRKLDMQSWPSTVSIAAIPWQRHMNDSAKPEVLAAATSYASLVAGEPGAKLSSARRIAGLEGLPPAVGDFSWLSGNFLNSSALANEQGTPLRPNTDRKSLLRQLKKLEELTDDRAGNCYGLLLMDGDNTGRLIGEHGAAVLTARLTNFAARVPDLIESQAHSGICIYAGGDDLLAMLPLDRALDAVGAARALYLNSFADSGNELKATISAGLVFAHYRCAFSRVLEYAHELLHNVAKDGADRDALAIAVLKPGGVACRWVGKFGQFIHDGSHCFAPLIAAYSKEANHDGRGLSSSFLYNLRERFGELFEPVNSAGEEDHAGRDTASEPFDEDALQRLFVAEYLHGRLDKDPAEARRQRDEAERLMRQLIAVCYQPDARRGSKRRFDLDGARLVKFLALGGKEGAE